MGIHRERCGAKGATPGQLDGAKGARERAGPVGWRHPDSIIATSEPDLRLSLHSLEILAQCIRDATPYFCSSMPLRESWWRIVAWGGVAWCHA